MRRRIIENAYRALPVTLSATSYTATPASGTQTVIAYYGGVPITDLTSSMVSKSGNMSSVSVNSSGVITMRYNANYDTSNSKTSIMTLTYEGQTVTFTITQPKDYVTGTTSYSDVDANASYITFDSSSVSYNTSTLAMTGTLNFPYHIERNENNYTVYASGNIVYTSTTTDTYNGTFPLTYLKWRRDLSSGLWTCDTSGFIQVTTGIYVEAEKFSTNSFSDFIRLAGVTINWVSSSDESCSITCAYHLTSSQLNNPSPSMAHTLYEGHHHECYME